MEEPVDQNLFKKAMSSAQYLQKLLPPELERPVVGIICGSGLSGLADAVNPDLQVEVFYQDIPYFPQSTGTRSTTTTREECPLLADRG